MSAAGVRASRGGPSNANCSGEEQAFFSASRNRTHRMRIIVSAAVDSELFPGLPAVAGASPVPRSALVNELLIPSIEALRFLNVYRSAFNAPIEPDTYLLLLFFPIVLFFPATPAVPAMNSFTVHSVEVIGGGDLRFD